MFGIIRPCPHRLSPALHADWVAHLCGLCLTLRDHHGQLARTATNYDGLVISALVEAQRADTGARRLAGPCPLRGMRRAAVAGGEGSALAASVSLVLASAKVRDHAEDGDGALRHRSLASLARSAAGRWSRQGGATAALVGLDPTPLAEAVAIQSSREAAVGLGDSVLSVTEPTETATAAAFAHTAVLAGNPGDAETLSEVGRFFGRVAHLLDAVEDRDADLASGAWNPLTATGTSLPEARRLCDDAVRGVRLALHEVTFRRPGLVHALLVHELEHAVTRTFGHRSPPPSPGGPHQPNQPQWSAHGPHHPAAALPGSELPPQDADRHDGPPAPPPHDRFDVADGDGGGCWVPKFSVPPRAHNALVGCLLVPYQCCTCQYCCRDPWPGPWSGRPHTACCEYCECCSCCECGSCG
ncbi:hypothetical protein B1813_08395 [Saccharomonospora piscinae]|uniref:Uncharacterized protein n=1 Tax=Saccharomonospora piscinae TaxID=687388 RepID=A0A1V9A589_SACPI|nr:DUF5685 family protein [Saccharomonospora piscinae]OQO92241.1 hypothetical protein B1813_08395 [Saccharomonospora piscinae]